MQSNANQDYKILLSEVIKKQIVILGPDITLAKARNVKGLTVLDDGTVTEISGEPQTITKDLINQFVQLSGLIVQKTMEPLLMYHPDNIENTPTEKQSEPKAPEASQEVASVAAPKPTFQSPLGGANINQSQPIPNSIPTTPVAPTTPVNTFQADDTQLRPEQIDTQTQKIIDDALKTNTN